MPTSQNISHNIRLIKRQAKSIANFTGIPHHEALDQEAGRAGFASYKQFLACNSKKKLIPRGTLCYLHKNPKDPARVLKHDIQTGAVAVYGHAGGPAYLARYEISVPRDQSEVIHFKPRRLYLPYGKWLCKNEIEVLFNRNYQPIWLKKSDGTIHSIDPDTHIPYKDSHMYEDISTREKILKEWGIENQTPKILALFPKIFKTGNTDIIKNTYRNDLSKFYKYTDLN